MAYDHKFEEMCADGETFGPVPEVAVAAAEADLNVKFPEQYREFLQRYGSGLFRGAEIYGLPDNANSANLSGAVPADTPVVILTPE